MKIWYIWSRETSGNESESYECSRLQESKDVRFLYILQLYNSNSWLVEKRQSIFVDSDLQDLPDAVVSEWGRIRRILARQFCICNGMGSLWLIPHSIERASDKLVPM